MRRRDFLKSASALAAVRVSASPLAGFAREGETAAAPPVGGAMYAGSQFDRVPSDDDLRWLAALGVRHVCSGPPAAHFDQSWSATSLEQIKARAGSVGIALDMIALPMASSYIASADNPNIILGKSPERDREIDGICEIIRNVALAGIPAVKYNLTILGVVRTGTTPARGSARYSTFVYANAKQDPPLTAAGEVSPDEMWERITYFLERVVPVATENKVRLACHPHDPGMPADTGFRGVHRVLGSVAGLKRFVEIQPSPYHGLNFCQGTVSEMLDDPGREVFDVIRYFGTRRKIFNVHFRNIKGHFLDFEETFPDDGDVNMVEALKTYREVGYDGMIMPDHAPEIDGDSDHRQAFAFEFGYIQALLQAIPPVAAKA
jgi:mannonate dehydratase